MQFIQNLQTENNSTTIKQLLLLFSAVVAAVQSVHIVSHSVFVTRVYRAYWIQNNQIMNLRSFFVLSLDFCTAIDLQGEREKSLYKSMPIARK